MVEILDVPHVMILHVMIPHVIVTAKTLYVHRRKKVVTCNACSRTQMPWNENKSKETLLINSCYSCYTLVVMFRVVCGRFATPNHS